MRPSVRDGVPASAVCIWLLMAGPVLVSAQDPIRIHVDDPRPVAAAVLDVEKHFGRVVTYEDTSYVHPSDVVDVTEQVRRRGDMSKRAHVMRNGTIDVIFTPAPGAPDDQIRQLLQEVLAASKAAGNTGEFKIESESEGFHIIPLARNGTKGMLERYVSPLDARITYSCENENGIEFIERFARTVSAATARRITPGMFPTNLFAQRRVGMCADQEKAREVLRRGLQSIRQDLSWQMLCEVGERSGCAINVHPVGQR